MNELLDLRTCRVCGAPIQGDNGTERGIDDVCVRCAVGGSGYSGDELPQGLQEEVSVALAAEANLQPPSPVDPDNPPWGPLTGLSTWAFSIAASIVIPLIPLLLILFGKAFQGASPESLQAWAASANALLVLTIATFPAQVLILIFCWAIVTRRGKRPFLETLGWHWAGRSALYWTLVSIGVVIAINIASNLLLGWLPDKVSPFEELLRSSASVRIATVVLAIIGAPIVEEVVYRGVLFSGLRKRLSSAATVVAVTFIFVAVHVPQYLGAWRTLAGLTILSFALTIARARTASVLPSFLIHLVNNALSSIAILVEKGG